MPLESLAHIDLVQGASQIKREMAKRRIVIGINVRDRDLGGYVAELQKKVGKQVVLPAGYYYEWGGQFQNMERARRHLMIIVPITVGAIFFLLFMLFRSLRLASLIILVLPFASIGGIAALFVNRRVFIRARFGRIYRVVGNGGIEWSGASVLYPKPTAGGQRNVRRSCRARSSASSGDDDSHGRRAWSGPVSFRDRTGIGSARPLAIVVIGGLVTSTLLTLVIVPILYRWFEPRDTTSEIEEQISVALG